MQLAPFFPELPLWSSAAWMPGSELRPWVHQALPWAWLSGWGRWCEGSGGMGGGLGKAELLVKAILPPPAVSAVATCQKNQQGEKMTEKNQAQFITFKSC